LLSPAFIALLLGAGGLLVVTTLVSDLRHSLTLSSLLQLPASRADETDPHALALSATRGALNLPLSKRRLLAAHLRALVRDCYAHSNSTPYLAVVIFSRPVRSVPSHVPSLIRVPEQRAFPPSPEAEELATALTSHVPGVLDWALGASAAELSALQTLAAQWRSVHAHGAAAAALRLPTRSSLLATLLEGSSGTPLSSSAARETLLRLLREASNRHSNRGRGTRQAVPLLSPNV
jgi:hypothetical protein